MWRKDSGARTGTCFRARRRDQLNPLNPKRTAVSGSFKSERSEVATYPLRHGQSCGGAALDKSLPPAAFGADGRIRH